MSQTVGLMWIYSTIFFSQESGRIAVPKFRQIYEHLLLSPRKPKENSGEGPAISLDQDELLLGKEPEGKKC